MSIDPDPTYVDVRAEVSPDAELGPGCQVWDWTKVREGARIGSGTTIGQGCYVDHGVVIGARCKVQNGVNLYHGVTLGDEVFVGPSVTFTNDLHPRAVGDWEVTSTVVEDGASIGANSTIVCGVVIGAGAMIGAGSVVLVDVPPGALVVGNPGRIIRQSGDSSRHGLEDG